MESETIGEKLKKIHADILEAEKGSGRKTGSVKLMCVSKTKPVSMIEEAYAAGERDFGENYVQELTAKVPVLPKDIIWHMIGPLQKNKVKKAVANAAVIHAVHNLELAVCIDKEAGKLGKLQDIMLEINTGDEESKHGFGFEEAVSAAREVSELENVRLIGLMCIPPFDASADETRSYFRKMRETLERINKEVKGLRLTELSMGMSSDYKLAIEEGATYIRIGTGIFGARDYSKKQED